MSPDTDGSRLINEFSLPNPELKRPQPADWRAAAGSSDPSNVVVGRGTRLRGEITNCKQLEIYGYADGEFEAAKIVVHEGGELHGAVKTEDAIVMGVLDGKVQIENKLDVRENGVVAGEVAYRELSVETGGSMTGKFVVGEIGADADADASAPKCASQLNGDGHDGVTALAPIDRLLGKGPPAQAE